jgi:hypothetical protein
MTQNRAWPDAEHRCHPARSQVSANVTDPVDAAGNSTKQSSRNPILDRTPSQPQRQELTPRDEPMLSLRQVSHQSIEGI